MDIKEHVGKQKIRIIIEKYDKLSEYRTVSFEATKYSDNTDPTDHFGDYTKSIENSNKDVWDLIEFCRKIVDGGD